MLIWKGLCAGQKDWQEQMHWFAKWWVIPFANRDPVRILGRSKYHGHLVKDKQKMVGEHEGFQAKSRKWKRKVCIL